MLFLPDFFSHYFVSNLNHGSFYHGKDSLQLHRFKVSKMNQLLASSAICL